MLPPFRTPVMKKVTHVYIDFLSVDENGQLDGGRTKLEITDAKDKAYLISFFNNRFWLGDEYGCGCPIGDVLFIFQTNTNEYKYGLGIGGLWGGDPNLFYFNENTRCKFSNEQLYALLSFLSSYEGTRNYNANEHFRQMLEKRQQTGDNP
jgi:hypothetical protein